MFRRNFDRELVEQANGRRPWTTETKEGKTTPASGPEPASRFIVVRKSDRVLADLLAYNCSIKPVGDDWHIRAKTKGELDAVVAMLQRNRIHGILKRLPSA